ncbi:MAG: response regulator [Ignavibacteriaceae bacterium]
MKKRILIIEDEKQLLKNISLLLKSENYDVISCSDGGQSLNLVEQFKPDLIICDIMLPGLDGYEILRELRNDGEAFVVPFIFLTAKVERSDFRKGMELGADDYIFKPFKSDELLHAIQTRLNKFEITKARILDSIDNGNGTQKYKFGENVLLKLHNSNVLIAVEKIKFIEASNQYSLVVLDDNRQILIRRSVAKWKSLLPENVFLRIHRSTIINTKYICKIENCKNKHNVILKNTEKRFNISRRCFKKLDNP